ncbi:MAG: SGNH/GDSL hydrolase family protein [Planctomycetes bacterium]|nr:SGNH/GDSL hydrolase family protein [Planctomycetota bacterium]
MRKCFLRLFLVATSLIGILTVVEVGFRLSNKTAWYQRLYEVQNKHQPKIYRIGNRTFKLRAPLPTAAKSAGEYRILFLGDSFTYGSGVEDATKVFPSLVTQELNKRKILGPETIFTFYNGGTPGSLPKRWKEMLKEIPYDFEPDLVFITFFLRDGTSGIGSLPHIQVIGEGLARLEESSLLFRLSYTYRYFRERNAQRELSRTYLESMHSAYFGDESQTMEWKRAKKDLLELRDDSLSRGARFALATFPVLFDLDEEDYPLQAVCDEIERFACSQKIPVFSLLPAFRGLPAPDLWVAPLDQHPNELGHRIAADALIEFIEAQARASLDSNVGGRGN